MGCDPDTASTQVDDSADTDSPSVHPPGGNVLLLVLDDMGADKIKAYDVTAFPLRTPNLDSLVATGMRFDNAWALPYCGPSRAALQTGRHARRTGIGTNESILASHAELDSGQTTLPEMIASSPWLTYTTSYAGKWHLSTHESPSGPNGPAVQGWSWYAGALGNLDQWKVYDEPAPADPGYFEWQKIDVSGAFVTSEVYATSDTVNDALDRIAAMPEPWLLQVAFNAAHPPFNEEPPAHLVHDDPIVGFEVRDTERRIVEALDIELGRLLAGIPVEVRARTNILVVGDNGSGTNVAEDEIDPDRTKGSVYEPGVRVPFVVQGPLVAEPGSTSDALVHLVDVFPTIAEIAGVDLSLLGSVLDPAVPLAIDGRSLLPVLADPDLPHHDFLYTERFNPGGEGPYNLDLRTVRDAGYKLMVDEVHEIEQFFRYTDGATDEGLDLLPCGLDATEQEAYERLSAALDELRINLVYDGVDTSTPGDDPPPEESDTALLLDIGCDVGT